MTTRFSLPWLLLLGELSLTWAQDYSGKSSNQAVEEFKSHLDSSWLKKLNDQEAALSRGESVNALTAEGQKIAIDAPNRLVETEDGGAELQDSQGCGVFKISPEQRQYQERLKSYYERGDQEAFDELQAFGEQRSQQLNTEGTVEGEAYRALTGSHLYNPPPPETPVTTAPDNGVYCRHRYPDRPDAVDCNLKQEAVTEADRQRRHDYYPDANDERMAVAERSIEALKHPNTWKPTAEFANYPRAADGHPLYDNNRDMHEAIVRLRQHFVGCEYDQRLVPRANGKSVSSPKVEECLRVAITDESLALQRYVEVSELMTLLDHSQYAGKAIEPCQATGGQGCVQLRLGKDPRKDRDWDNYYSCHCCEKEEFVRARLLRPQAITGVSVPEAQWDDYLSLYLNDRPLREEVKSGQCDLEKNHHLPAPIPVDALILHGLGEGDTLTFRERVIVGDKGEGNALLRIRFDLGGLVKKDHWGPPEALKRFQRLQQQARDGMCQLHLECLETFDPDAFVVHGQTVPLTASLSGVPTDCKRLRAQSDCQYYKHDACRATGRRDYCRQEKGQPPDYCFRLQQQGCRYLPEQSECLAEQAGICYTRLERYDCGQHFTLHDIKVEESLRCHGQPMNCMLGECKADVTDADNSDFAEALAALQAAQQMAQDLQCEEVRDDSGQVVNVTNCQVFKGEACTCKQTGGLAGSGLVDCCNLPHNVNFGTYLQALTAGYLFDKSMMYVDGQFPNQITGSYQQLRDPISRGAETLMKPAKTIWSNMGQSWDKLTAKLWPTPAETGAQTAIAQPLAGEVTQEAEKGLLAQFQHQVVQRAAEAVNAVLGSNATNALFVAEGGSPAVVGGQLTGAPLQINPAITTALSTVMALYTAYTLWKLGVQMAFECEEDEFALSARREMRVCYRVGTYTQETKGKGVMGHVGVIGQKAKLLEVKFTSYCCFNSPLSKILNRELRQQLGLGWGSPKHPDCRGLTPEELQDPRLDWDKVDLSDWLGLLAETGKLDVLTAKTEQALKARLDKISLETLTGPGSRLDIDGTRKDTRQRIQERFDNVTADNVEGWQGEKTSQLRDRFKQQSRHEAVSP